MTEAAITKRATHGTHRHRKHRSRFHVPVSLWELFYSLSVFMMAVGIGMVAIGSFIVLTLLDTQSYAANANRLIGPVTSFSGLLLFLFGHHAHKRFKRHLPRYRFRKERLH